MRIKITSGNLFIALMIIITIIVLYIGASMIFMNPYEPMGYLFLGFVIGMAVLLYKQFTGRWADRSGIVTKTSVTCKNCGRNASLLPIIEDYASIYGLPSKTVYDDHCPFCGRKY
jgi:hypothetical protein